MPFDKNLQWLQNKYEREISIMKNIECKLQDNEAILKKADKDKTLVFVQKSDYDIKVNNFISSDNNVALSGDPTKEYTTSLHARIEKYESLLHNETHR